MNFGIITPSFRQFDWLRLCIVSAQDQWADGSEVENIIQDAGSPGIDGFARETGAARYRNGEQIFPELKKSAWLPIGYFSRKGRRNVRRACAQEAGIRMGVLRQFTSIFTETEANLPAGGASDREIVELRARMPEHVQKFLWFYELAYKIRSFISDTRWHPAFSYDARILANPSRRQHFGVSGPTAVWKGRTANDKTVSVSV